METLNPEVLAAFNEYKVQKEIEKNAKERIEALKLVIVPAMQNDALVDPVTGTLLMQRIEVKKTVFDNEAFRMVNKDLYDSFCNPKTEYKLMVKDKTSMGTNPLVVLGSKNDPFLD